MNVLMISPFFAPCTIVAALRMTSLAKYLVSRNVKVTVIKVEDSFFGDPAVIATGAPVDGVTYKTVSVDVDDPAYDSALRQAIDEVCTRDQFDCCVASFGPFSSIPAVLTVRSQYHIPLVIDYRDLWLYHPSFDDCRGKEKLLQQYLLLRFHRLEKRLMDRCTAFVSVTPRSVKKMESHYPCLLGKTHCIYNGYSEIPLHPDTPVKGQTSIYVLGKFSYYSPERTRQFFRAIYRLIEEGASIQIVHIGAPEDALSSIMESLHFPEDHFLEMGRRPYSEVLQLGQKADILAFIEKSGEGIATKVFDYVYLNKPIISLGPANSEYGELLKPAENAFLCQSEEQVESAIRQICSEHLTCLTKDSDYREKFSRTRQNERYYQLLQKVSSL